MGGARLQSRLLIPLRNPLFRRLWLGNMSANLGTMFLTVGASWLMVTMTESPLMVALVQSSVTLPLLLLSLLSGAMADTLDRYRIMLVAQIHMFAMSAVLSILVATGILTPSLLLLFTFLIGCGAALHNPSWQASLRDIVGRSDVPLAVALHATGFNLMRSGGPAIGGAILAAAGAVVLFALNALCYLVMVVMLLLWRSEHPKVSMREPIVSALVSGLRYSLLSPNIVVIARSAMFSLLAVVLVALLPVVAREIVGGEAVLYGALLGSYGLGAVAAAILGTSVRDRLSTEQITTIIFVVMGIALLAIALTGQGVVVFLSTFVAGCCWVMATSTFNIAIQLSTATWVVGRSISILHTGVFGGMTIGSWVWGDLAERYDVETALTVSAVCLFAAALVGRLFPLPALSDDPLEPANRFREPQVKVDIEKHPGPISITIHFLIEAEDVPEFLSVMQRRRQVRRRDGALRWSLRRDVERPGRWVESYQVQSWADYLRHNQRRTETDARLNDILLSLHRGAQPPIVLRMVEWDASGGEPD